MPAPDNIKNLVIKFRQNIEQYKSASYNETETRVDFLNPFWKELGWDVNNEVGYAINYRDVIHEDSIRLKGVGTRHQNSKAPDYAFRIGGVRKFFLEAKKPSVDIHANSSPAYQLRCYGWSCGLPLSVLSNFDEFAVYDCRVRPKNTDRADTARIRYLTFEQYVDCWDDIAKIFHRENILRGSFDRFVDSRKSKTGTSEVDVEFLREIEDWRLMLAKDLAKNHPEMDVRTLNFTIQRTIDRLIFLRMAEDRGIEPEDQLWDLIQRPDIYKNLLDVYRTADEKYNSGFFHFTDEPEQTEAPDTLTPTLNFSDHTLSEILKRVYPPVSPYRFEVLPVEILGNVYERFLGNIIRLTPTRQVKVENKPEVKKANGVFYTPPYIVDYIVQNTVGKLCEGKKPREVSTLKILDPACGSGSFLLGAYKYLMNWHLTYYTEEMNQTGKIPQSPPALGSRKKKSDPYALYQTVDDEWKLTLAERKRILLNNIYGVDLDAQAVEVTKLSLSLCVLEGFNDEILESNLRFFYDRALPNLARNIRCGNSLIGPDYYLDSQAFLSPDFQEEQYTVNAFDWYDTEHGFGKIMREGGFDAVIGNPPYVDSEEMTKSNPELRKYASSRYETARGNWDMYCIYSEKGVLLTRNNGFTSFIIPNKFLSAPYGVFLRQYLANLHVCNIQDYSSVSVFGTDRAIHVYPIVFVVKKTAILGKTHYIKIGKTEDKVLCPIRETSFQLEQGDTAWVVKFSSSAQLLSKIMDKSSTIQEYYHVENSATVHEAYQIKELIEEAPSNTPHQKLINTGTIDRYACLWGIDRTRYIGDNYQNPIVPFSGLQSLVPQRLATILSPKIVIAGMVKKLEATFVDETFYPAKSTTTITEKTKGKFSLKYLLGLLNSKLYTYLFVELNKHHAMSGGYMTVSKKQIAPFLFYCPQDSEKTIHETLVRKVEEILTLHRRIQEETLDTQQRTMMERQISFLDRHIDTLVYQLYGLTEDEIRMVEENLP